MCYSFGWRERTKEFQDGRADQGGQVSGVVRERVTEWMAMIYLVVLLLLLKIVPEEKSWRTQGAEQGIITRKTLGTRNGESRVTRNTRKTEDCSILVIKQDITIARQSTNVGQCSRKVWMVQAATYTEVPRQQNWKQLKKNGSALSLGSCERYQ